MDTLKSLREYTVLINLIGVIQINEAIIKLVLPGSECKIIIFRCKKQPLPKLHQDWLKKMGFHRTNLGLKGYLEGKGETVINSFLL